MRIKDGFVLFNDYPEGFLNGGGHLNYFKWTQTESFKNFKGPKVHSAQWGSSRGLVDKRVMIIGAGIKLRYGLYRAWRSAGRCGQDSMARLLLRVV